MSSSLIVGAQAIGAYLGVGPRQVSVLIRRRGLPVLRVRRPEGRIATTRSLVDQWIVAQSRLENQRLDKRHARRRSA